jgi:hypothetical protein
MYYKLHIDRTAGLNVYVKRANNISAMLDEGQPIDVEEEGLQLPFEYSMTVSRNKDGSPQEIRMAVYYPEEELMHKDLVEALRGAGVDNLQAFPAIIREKDGDRVVDDYLTVNVIGLVEAADGERSDAMPFADGAYFNKLAIDPARAGELPMFRLAESQMDVLVHEDVAKKLTGKNFRGLKLTALK